MYSNKKNLTRESSRRSFIKKLSTISFGSLLLSSTKDAHSAGRVISYRSLGDTSIKVSDISFGTGGLSNYRVALRGMSKGINYFDTAPDYGAGSSEQLLGKAISKTRLSRDKIVVATKMCSMEGYPGHMYNASKEEYIKSVEDSLKRLRTDYIDFLLVHALGERDSSKELYRLKDSAMLEAYYSLQKAGKVRYLGVSSHNYAAALDGGMDYAIDSGHFKLVMLAYNFKDRGPGKALLSRLVATANKAKKKGVAFVAMKTLRGASGLNNSLDDGRSDYAQSAFKWVLSNSSVSCLVVTMRDYDHIDEYLKASGQKLSASDINRLKLASASDNDCELGCSSCESVCPEKLNISSILRYNMYFKGYGREKYAMQKYKALSVNTTACSSCSAPCTSACEFNVDVKKKLYEAHANLSLA